MTNYSSNDESSITKDEKGHQSLRNDKQIKAAGKTLDTWLFFTSEKFLYLRLSGFSPLCSIGTSRREHVHIIIISDTNTWILVQKIYIIYIQINGKGQCQGKQFQ